MARLWQSRGRSAATVAAEILSASRRWSAKRAPRSGWAAVRGGLGPAQFVERRPDRVGQPVQVVRVV